MHAWKYAPRNGEDICDNTTLRSFTASVCCWGRGRRVCNVCLKAFRDLNPVGACSPAYLFATSYRHPCFPVQGTLALWHQSVGYLPDPPGLCLGNSPRKHRSHLHLVFDNFTSRLLHHHLVPVIFKTYSEAAAATMSLKPIKLYWRSEYGRASNLVMRARPSLTTRQTRFPTHPRFSSYSKSSTYLTSHPGSNLTPSSRSRTLMSTQTAAFLQLWIQTMISRFGSLARSSR